MKQSEREQKPDIVRIKGKDVRRRDSLGNEVLKTRLYNLK